MADQAPVTNRPDSNVRASARRFPWEVDARRGGLLVAAGLAVTGAIFVWQASLLDLGHLGLPGPGFLPLVLGAVLVVLAIVIGINGLRTSDKGPPVELGHPRVLIALAALLPVPLVFEQLGAYLTLGLLSAAMLVFIARLSPVLAGVWTVLGMAACWLVFQVLLGVRLPMGPF
jgi:hypothetical protein